MYWVLCGLTLFFAGLSAYWKVRARTAETERDSLAWTVEAYETIDDTKTEIGLEIDGKPFIKDSRPMIFGDGYESN